MLTLPTLPAICGITTSMIYLPMNCDFTLKNCYNASAPEHHQEEMIMIEGEPPSFPTNSVAKEDLLFCRPDLEQEIEALADSDVQRIANRVERPIQEAS